MLLGRLDLKLFAGAETDNAKAATRLASDMGEFFMPFPGTRINQADRTARPRAICRAPLVLRREVHRHHQARRSDLGRRGRQCDTDRGAGHRAPRGQRNERWFVVWLGSANNPVDKAAAATLASSIRPWSPPPPPPPEPNAPPDPNAPPADPNAPAPNGHRRGRRRRRPGDPANAPPG